MQEAPPPAPAMLDDDDTRLESLGYRPAEPVPVPDAMVAESPENPGPEAS